MIDCAQVHERLRASEPGELDPRVRAHLEGCPACAELAAGDRSLARALEEGFGDSFGDWGAKPGLRAGLDSAFVELEVELGRPVGRIEALRQRSTRVRGALLGAVALLVVGLVAGGMPRADLDVHPLPPLLLCAVALVTVTVWAGALLLRPLHRPSPPAWLFRLITGAALLAPILIAALPAAHHAHPASLGGLGDELLPRALACFVFGSIWSVVLLAAGWALDRAGLGSGGGSGGGSRGRAALGLLGAGALGNLTLLLHCPLVEPAHKLAGHATISVAALIAALVVGLRRQGADQPPPKPSGRSMSS